MYNVWYWLSIFQGIHELYKRDAHCRVLLHLPGWPHRHCDSNEGSKSKIYGRNDNMSQLNFINLTKTKQTVCIFSGHPTLNKKIIIVKINDRIFTNFLALNLMGDCVKQRDPCKWNRGCIAINILEYIV